MQPYIVHTNRQTVGPVDGVVQCADIPPLKSAALGFRRTIVTANCYFVVFSNINKLLAGEDSRWTIPVASLVIVASNQSNQIYL